MTDPLGDMSVQSIDDAMPGISDMVVEGRELSPGGFQMVELPPKLAAAGDAGIDVMVQVIEPHASGTLICTTQSGDTIFERNLAEAMQRVGKWRPRMVFQFPRLSAAYFPLKISCRQKAFRLSYVFFRAVPAPRPS
jgi:hypothetical protein